MNYALPINVFVWIMAGLMWVAWGRRRWAGLDLGVVEMVVRDGDRETKE